MAEQKDVEQRALDSPDLLWPREGGVVDGQSVRFAWTPVEGVLEYRLEVASDPSFETLAFERSVHEETSLMVPNVFETDDRTYYWRVLARYKSGWSPGEIVESFISGTLADVETHATPPDRSERLGPLTELITGGSEDVLYLHSRDVGTPAPSGHEEELGPASGLVKAASLEVAAEVTGVEGYYEEEAEMGIQHEGVEAKQILGLVLVVLVSLAVIIVILFQLTDLETASVQRRVAAEVAYPELRETNAEAARLLNQYDVVSDQEGVYRMPIDRAMQLMVNEARQDRDRQYSSELRLQPGN